MRSSDEKPVVESMANSQLHMSCVEHIFISFHIFMEGGPSVITDLQGALRLHYTYITRKRKIITNMKTNYNVYKV